MKRKIKRYSKDKIKKRLKLKRREKKVSLLRMRVNKMEIKRRKLMLLIIAAISRDISTSLYLEIEFLSVFLFKTV
jgi:hypothetical protein